MSRKSSTADFIEKARKIHGDKYDYSKVDYINNHTKVCVTCPIHGEFWQSPDKHLSGQGCPNCSNTKKSNTETFVEKAKKIHGDKYDYSKVVYDNNHTKVCIICKEHGEFWQTPHNHLRGRGCPECSKLLPHPTKLTTEKFIERAKQVHGDKYDYSKVDYVGMNIKVCIVCKEHGEFLQTPSSHLQGNGCPVCGHNIVGMKIKSSTEEFIEKAKKMHGDKYDYSKTLYTEARSKLIITCKEHGDFLQAPYHHLQGNGCPVCANTKKLTTEEFIERARQIHGDRYDYSKVVYENMHSKVCIICPIHGEFWQQPLHHLEGKGCSICSYSHLEREINEFLVENNIIFEGQKRFAWLGKLSLDFYLPEYNIAIECQGIQHFKPNEHFGGEEQFKKQIKFDEYKKKCCDEHYIKLLYYSKCDIDYGYHVYNNLESLLEEINNTKKLYNNSFKVSDIKEEKTNVPTDLIDFIHNLIGKENVVMNDNNIIGENITFFVPSLNVGIIYNQLHNGFGAMFTQKNFNLNKLKLCNKKGIKLLQIFEDEFFFNKEIVFNKIAHILKCQRTLPTIMGRKCKIKEIKVNEAKEFLTKYHIQGYTPSTIYLGAFYDNELIGVMSFKKDVNRNKTIEDNSWDLTRFASTYNYICQGIGGKLFNYFVKNYEYNEIKSFADRRWTVDEENNLYKQLGFEFDSYLTPDYRYIDCSEHPLRHHKFGYRIQILHKKYGFPLTMTEREMTKQLGLIRIYDCGLIKYIYRKRC